MNGNIKKWMVLFFRGNNVQNAENLNGKMYAKVINPVVFGTM